MKCKLYFIITFWCFIVFSVLESWRTNNCDENQDRNLSNFKLDVEQLKKKNIEDLLNKAARVNIEQKTSVKNEGD